MHLNKKKIRKHFKSQDNTIRIIGGEWRGRKVKFASEKGLRPTLDRVRETLFNWLQADINQANCLDLFSGSGALSFEALSRGAKQVDIVEINSTSAQLIRDNLAKFNCQHANVFLQSAQEFIKQQTVKSQAYDIVFLDPPFNQALLVPICLSLDNSSLIQTNTIIYIESEVQLDIGKLPENWQCYREKQTKNLSYYLFICQ
ncbi:MAG: 16S rRNA (guanine(966)-N(2))-methyltransferase RsmD [Gammaproteobacteria bacterium]|nr:16S rRNA (guanine(966)-N(2))-methyltransferase RsmD [Gammaproteobacteria bacterium]